MKKSVITTISILAGAIAGAGSVGMLEEKKISEAKNMADKQFALFMLMNQWVKVKQDGKNLASYFEKNGYKKIAVYGMSYVGETFIDELRGTGIEVAYAIDKNADFICADIDVVSMETTLNKVDAIVVTAITFFDEIEKKLSEKTNCAIISLEDIVYDV